MCVWRPNPCICSGRQRAPGWAPVGLPSKGSEDPGAEGLTSVVPGQQQKTGAGQTPWFSGHLEEPGFLT